MNFIGAILVGGSILIDLFGVDSKEVDNYYNAVREYHQGKADKQPIKKILTSIVTTDKEIQERIKEVVNCMLV